MSHYQIGDEFYIRKILKGIVFNPEYLDPTDSMIWQMKNTEISKGSNAYFITVNLLFLLKNNRKLENARECVKLIEPK